MGLCTTAYEFAEHVPGHTASDDDWDNDIVRAWAYPEFRRALDGLVGRDENCAWGVGGQYYRTSGRDVHTHTSYSGHFNYRGCLARAAHGMSYEAFCKRLDPDMAFFDLLWFADNEGVIGPVASRRLADAYAALPDIGEYWQSRHEALGRSFELAADTGLVVFA